MKFSIAQQPSKSGSLHKPDCPQFSVKTAPPNTEPLPKSFPTFSPNQPGGFSFLFMTSKFLHTLEYFLNRIASSLCPVKDIFIQALFRSSDIHPVSKSFPWPLEYIPHRFPRLFLNSLGHELYNRFSTSPLEPVQVHSPLYQSRSSTRERQVDYVSLRKLHSP